MYAQHVYEGFYRGQKRVSDTLELYLQVVVSHLIGTRNEPEEQQVLLMQSHLSSS